MSHYIRNQVQLLRFISGLTAAFQLFACYHDFEGNGRDAGIKRNSQLFLLHRERLAWILDRFAGRIIRQVAHYQRARKRAFFVGVDSLGALAMSDHADLIYFVGATFSSLRLRVKNVPPHVKVIMLVLTS